MFVVVGRWDSHPNLLVNISNVNPSADMYVCWAPPS